MIESPIYVEAVDAHAISIIAQSSNRPRAFQILKRDLLEEAALNPEMRFEVERTLRLLSTTFPEVKTCS